MSLGGATATHSFPLFYFFKIKGESGGYEWPSYTHHKGVERLKWSLSLQFEIEFRAALRVYTHHKGVENT